MKRYQNCGWLEKRCRDRHLLQVPYQTLKGWALNLNHEYPLTLKQSYRVARGLCDAKRNWIYSWDEMQITRSGVKIAGSK